MKYPVLELYMLNHLDEVLTSALPRHTSTIHMGELESLCLGLLSVHTFQLKIMIVS